MESSIMSRKHRIAIVSGSYRPQSLTRLVVKHAEALALKRGLETDLLCARELDLPIYDAPEVNHLPNVKRWREAIQRADVVFVGSPEYHGAFSGVLKNMIDYLDFPHIEGKPVALVSAAGGIKSGIGALNGLRLVFRALHAPVIVEQATFWEGDFNAESGKLNSDALRQLLNVIDGLIKGLA
jgi:NAD(P)H-dependent FMN reductase